MPELPEVETVIRWLRPVVKKQTFSKLTVHYPKLLMRSELSKINTQLKGKRVIDLVRRGKYILLIFDPGILLIHLRMTGKFLINKPSLLEAKYLTWQLEFKDQSRIYFKDIRKFGTLDFIKDSSSLEKKMGPEPLGIDFTVKYLSSELQKSKGIIKSFLLDQKKIAGLGNIYVDEALWLAGIHPLQKTNSLKSNQIKKLWSAIRSVLNKSIKHNGTTFINFQYGENALGNFAKYLKVFGKKGKACPKCKQTIVKIKVAQRGTHYCPQCQKC